MSRELIIQRFARCNWNALLGKRPFIVRGPVQYPLKALWLIVDEVFPVSIDHELAKRAIAEFLLSEGFVAAAWRVGFEPTVDGSILELADDVPHPGDEFPTWGEAVWELLDGMCGINYYRNYTSDEGLEYEIVPRQFFVV